MTTRDAALRTEALEQLLTERGLIDPSVMDKFIANYETNVGPLNGAKVVARAWVDPEYKARLLADGTAAIKEVAWGGGANGEHIVVVENTPQVHNVVVCTLCSWTRGRAGRRVLVQGPGIPGPRGARAPRVLREMGLELPAETQILVHDSSSEVRWLVLPQRPAGTEGLSEDELAGLVTRDALVGVATVSAP